MSRPLSLAFVCVLLVGAVLGPGVLAAPGPAGDSAVDSTSAAQADGDRALSTLQEFDRTRFVFTVYANGSARWTERHFRGLANDSERESFRTFADRFRTQETDVWTDFQQRATGLTAEGTDATGRNMTARNFNRSAGINSVGNGFVQMSFLWTDFAATADGRVALGDLFEGGGPYINEDQELSVVAGPSLTVVESESTDPDETATVDGRESRIWYGPNSFPSGLSVTYTVDEGAGEGTDTTGTDADGAGDDMGLLPLLLIGILVVAVGIGAGIAWRSGMFESDSGPDDDSGAGGSSDAPGGDDGGGAATEPAAATAVPDEELLSDEDRVISLLEDNGGRMKQADIVDETGWSKSKVSMLLSDMADEEDISKLRVGRENIISLKGHEPDAAGSPFDDE